uniref:NADH-ubiquinone oxidoreductase chain 6 n=1 Tax=Ctenolepisma villosum TaxID=257043 RepID=A0A6C0U8G6_9INSE|nr:NADH dehydrogenase subunit 6 [Ctenolepisma villosum]QIB71371.1 NADH dehydrogenase subunit 6 [Ctenolepisma villosum]
MTILILIMNAIIITQLTHPLSMGLMLIINTIITAVMITTMSESPWFSYILFLVFLGGMLVLFIYVTSLASNEMFSLKLNIMMFPSPFVLLIMIVMLTDITCMAPIPMSLQDATSMLTEYQNIPAMKFYNQLLMPITLMLATYLFITLIAVVKITSLYQGPLRMSKT